MAEIEHFVHPERKDHARFTEIKTVELNFLPCSIQMEGKTEVVRMTIGDAVAKVIDSYLSLHVETV
jgi:glycyl-tRNA synthetase